MGLMIRQYLWLLNQWEGANVNGFGGCRLLVLSCCRRMSAPEMKVVVRGTGGRTENRDKLRVSVGSGIF